jgi:hypothetical protein
MEVSGTVALLLQKPYSHCYLNVAVTVSETGGGGLVRSHRLEQQ